MGVPVIAVRQHGDRTDSSHLAGYDAAYKLFAPFPEILDSNIPSWIRDKTIYAPGFSRYSSRVLSRSTAREKLNISAGQKVVLVLNGKGGNKHSLRQIAAAAVVTPKWLWLVVGEVDDSCHLPQNLPQNVSVEGWCQDTYIYLKAADVAIASAGHNTVMEIGTAEVPFLCIPEFRPFNEQEIKAQALAKLGLCHVLKTFPSSDSIKAILERLNPIDLGKWKQIIASDGTLQAAQAITSEVKLLANYQQLSKVKSLSMVDN